MVGLKIWRWGSDNLERELRKGRPRPSSELEDRLLGQVAADPRVRSRRPRSRRLVVLAVVATGVLAALAGIGSAASKTGVIASSTAATVTDHTTAVVRAVEHVVKQGGGQKGGDKPQPATSSPAHDQYGHDKVTICHRTHHGSVTITISRSALPAHLAHGDTIGHCHSPNGH